jgi:3-isopropylmalate/(R)-2-methylmalate dehydratase small subunit
MSRRFTELSARVAPLLADDVDTDQIIPARYLKVVDRSGLAEGLFAAWRLEPGFALNRPESEGAQILLAGSNFGCGSSREHAPWALLAGGFRCVIARSFADIFMNNALKNGLLPVALADDAHAALVSARQADPALEVRVDLHGQVVSFAGKEARFSVDPFARRCLLEGTDPLGYLLSQEEHVAAFERAREAQR